MFKKIILSLLSLYAVLGFIILPIVLKSKVVEIANEKINANLSIDDIDFNPFIFRLLIYGVKLEDLSGKHLVSFDSFEIDINPHKLYNGTINIKKVLLSNPEILLEQSKDKTFNLASILKESDEMPQKQEKETSSKLPRITIDELALEGGKFTYTDYTKINKFHILVNDISFTLKDLDTDDFTSSGAEFRFHSHLGNGGKLDIKTNILGLKPLKIDGSIDFKLNKLYNHQRYVQDELGIEVANGKLSLYADYSANIDDLNSTSIDNLKISLADLRLKPKNENRDILNLKLLKINNASIKPFQQKVHVGDISLANLLVDFSIDENGNIDWLDYINSIDRDKDERTKSNAYAISVGNVNTHLDVNTVADNDSNESNMIVSNVDFKLNDFLFNDKTKNEKLAEFKKFEINDVNIDTSTKNILVSKIDLNGLGVYLRKDKRGMNIDGLIPSKESKETKEHKTKEKPISVEKPFSVKLKQVSLSAAEVNFNDESIELKTLSKLDEININAYNIDSMKNSWLDYDLSIRVNSGGTITSKGNVRHTPLKQKGKINIDKISLKEVTPYLQENMFVNINDGFVSLDSKVSYEKNDLNPDLHVEGSFALNSLEVADSRSDDVLLSVGKTNLKSFEFNMFPNSLYIDEIGLDSFYIDAVVDENKSMNLAKLTKAKSDDNLTKVEDSNTTASKKEENFPLKIMRLHVSNGAANFADYSLPVRFKTSIHDLNGDVYAISNKKGEVSYVDIDGEVDKYGSTKLKGSIEASNIKSYTDIEFSFKNLGLNSFSGYSAKFAGYKIEKGKLFLDLGYKIYDSELLGKNSLIIKSIELGDEVEDENITKLPLGFAIALLEDSDGVIDIDMPVEGNMDAPDFKYGALVLKTLVKLIVKAVASPFNFLGAAMGLNGDDLKYVEFEAAKFVILPPEKEKLDNIAKIIVKKPKLSLGITGSYSIEEDKESIQEHKLQLEVLKISGKNGVATIDVLEDIYSKSAGDKIVDALEEEFEKRYEKDEVFKTEYRKELFVRCRDIQVVSVDELKSLASSRAIVIREYLVRTKNIDLSRIILNEIQEENDGVKTALEIVLK